MRTQSSVIMEVDLNDHGGGPEPGRRRNTARVK